MGVCRYCNQKAGLFKEAHENCSTKADNARSSLAKLAADAVALRGSASNTVKEVAALRDQGQLSEAETKATLLQAADSALLDIALSEPLSNDDAERIGELFRSFDPEWFTDPRKLVNWPGYLTSIHSNSLYEVLHGAVPYYAPEMADGFILHLDEHPIVRRGAVLAEHSPAHVRSNNAISVPIGGGIYFRFGSSQPRSTAGGLTPVDQGTMLITTRGTYFGGQRTTVMIEHRSVLRLESYSDVVGVYPSHGKSKTFIPNRLGDIDDGWYFYNLISALAKQAHT